MRLVSGTRVLALVCASAWIILPATADRAAAQPASPPAPSASPAAPAQDIHIGYLANRRPAPPIYDYEDDPADVGIAGARIAMKDNATTGRLVGQTYALDESILDKGQSPVDAAKALVDKGAGLIVADLPADELLAVSDALKGRDATILNIGAEDDRLRNADCRANIDHFAPSRQMLTDALAQFLSAQRWRNVFMVVGLDPADTLYAEAMRRSVKKFGLKLTGDKPWTFGPLARQRADGPIRADAFIFTRGVDADMIVVADEAGNFGDFVQYHTAEPKLIGGTQGLTPATWSRVLDAWGSAQLQNRFVRTNKRPMRPLDYQAWTAIRAIGEAATRAHSASAKEIGAYMLRQDFEIAAFKGVPVSLRTWDRQLRQPILLVQPKMLVSLSPQTGFLHPITPLDSLGSDEPESGCKIRSGGNP
ncbi:ABC transporter substrate-binding protein [Beijerinckia sp. L45]|uniref:ABC transporter substrate-binding protein n=1 Tax=Beijerinckia sp. L45 TaxID=1641855 RepID=UPI001FF04D49|nr:ABC transporter substrate-binding protein [Beijerinckia sp. L45]